MKNLFLRACLIALALIAAPQASFAQSGPPPIIKMSDGSGRETTPSPIYCSPDAGTTWVPCSGGGGGGAATIADGADTTEGAKADASWSGSGSGSMVAISKALYAAMIAATPAGEAHVGEVGGNQLTIQSAQTVTASSAYASGNAVGGLMTLSNAARVSGSAGAPGTSGMLQSVVVDAKSAQSTEIDVFIFSANPTGTTCTDKTAFALAAADFDKVLGVAAVTSWFSGGTPSIGQAQNLAMPYALSSSTTLYACAVTRSTPTYTATTDISIGFRVLRN